MGEPTRNLFEYDPKFIVAFVIDENPFELNGKKRQMETLRRYWRRVLDKNMKPTDFKSHTFNADI